ncbi:MAG: putative metallo-hydrolase [Chthoniobacteraceae bacterium]|nr:putative metallo-hydrolase [Chthoniobacteraceae bacterium]
MERRCRAGLAVAAQRVQVACFMKQMDTFTGGIFDTNCFFLPGSGILVDAPQGAAEWLERKGHKISLLLLTHGHIDHVVDAARIQREHGCKVAYHRETEQMVIDPLFFKRLGFGWEIEPVRADFFISETDSVHLEGLDFQVFEVPGHCPGSLCFLLKEEDVLFGGDVLFASGVGRWDLPGGDRDLLFTGIRTKLFPLADNITVLPGHGPATKIGIERKTNPYVGENARD